jgi:3-dehydroquinate synthase
VERVRVAPSGHDAYDIVIDAGNLTKLGEVAKSCLSSRAQRAAVISNAKVYSLYGETVVISLKDAGFTTYCWLMGDGERFKSLRTLDKALNFLSTNKLERSDVVIALGGGVVGDLTGFAAATYLRGIPFIQVPTTLLSQIDSSVGGKTGVNLSTGKNLVGAFYQPKAVVIDVTTLQTLPTREMTAGLCEAVKQGAVGDRRLFDQTCEYLLSRKKRGVSLSTKQQDDLISLIAAQCAFKASIVADDEREDISRVDHRSRRILNFGHTVGHALEAITQYRRFRHGEAVGHGMVVAGELSERLGLLSSVELSQLRSAIKLTGKLPSAGDLDHQEILSALTHDKKSVGGHIKWILLEQLGRARIVDGQEISPKILHDALHAALI